MARQNSNEISKSVWGNLVGWQTTVEDMRKIGFSFETEYSRQEFLDWLKQNWTNTFYISAAYMVAIFGFQRLMRTRVQFDLRRSLVVWNFVLAIFALLGTLRMGPYMLHVLSQEGGFHQSVCMPNEEFGPVFGFWGHLFVLSKVPELVDTLFIVLRKQPLIFLHWYHHTTVLVYTWYAFMQDISTSRWFIVMNYAVHSIMYFYYGLRALRIRVPKAIAATITSLQILQMAVGVAVNVYALVVKAADTECDVPYDNIYWSLAMYGSYFLLFLNFFWKTYVSNERKKEATRRGLKID